MGCDIHAYIESKEFRDYWDEATIGLTRNYTMFFLMAGVRHGNVQAFEPRGLPEDVSGSVKEEYEKWGADAHTPSWLTTEELELCVEMYLEIESASISHYKAALAYMKEMKDARIVFWFDN